MHVINPPALKTAENGRIPISSNRPNPAVFNLGQQFFFLEFFLEIKKIIIIINSSGLGIACLGKFECKRVKPVRFCKCWALADSYYVQQRGYATHLKLLKPYLCDFIGWILL